MDNETLDIILEAFFDEYPGKPTDEERTKKHRTWMTILEDVTNKQGLIGLRKALNSDRDFMPPVGVFRGYCLSGKGNSSIDDLAVSSWGLVMSSLNSYVSPIFKDACIAEAIRQMGGWKKLCMMETSEEPFRKKDFISNYTIAKRRNGNYSPKLYGSYDDPVFIGFRKGEDTQKVLESVEQREAAKRQESNQYYKYLAGDRGSKQLTQGNHD